MDFSVQCFGLGDLCRIERASAAQVGDITSQSL